MTILLISGLTIVWIWSILFVLAVFKGRHRTRRYEQKLYPKYMANTRNIEILKKEDMERSILVLSSY